MSEHFFPKGFQSWQKTHFEVVEVLCYLRDLDEGSKQLNFAQMLDRTATEDLYQLAIKLTDKFESDQIDRSQGNLFDLIEEFVSKETKQSQ
ncbi:MAG TPA: hypothetical protein PK191_06275 [Niabella sp.]|nr:hypothetical protein [Niabella sp.]HOZ95604.1 hypothetical protein [Niabella sp.]HQW13844.1 hypothetical protein [Niabella sp.]HQX19263.1 hypothetical protein [Niabella sp.]HQX42106.1 hypothetical protein [Niabella sp.]